MSPRKNSNSSAFRSLRIIGEKAQKMLARASGDRGESPYRPTPPPIGNTDLPEVMVHVSVRSVAQAGFALLAIAFGVFLIFLLRDKLVLLLLAVFVAASIDPGVQALKKRGIPRGLAILIHYFTFLSLFLFLVFSLIPIIAVQLQQIAGTIGAQVNEFLRDPQIALPFFSNGTNERITEFSRFIIENLSIDHFTDGLQQLAQTMTSSAQGFLALAGHLAGSVVNFFISLIIVLVTAFFIQIEKERIIDWLRGFLPRRYRSYADEKAEAIQWRLAQWVRGQLLLCVIIGGLVFLALVILRMPYATTLAILAGFTEFLPIVGPLIAAVPAVIIAVTQGGWVFGLVVALVYYAIQWCENNLIVPLVMKRAVGLSAVAITFAMLVGISFPDVIHPVFGVILSIPLTTIVALFLEDLRAMNSPEEKVKKQ